MNSFCQKRYLAILLVLVLSVTLLACSRDGDPIEERTYDLGVGVELEDEANNEENIESITNRLELDRVEAKLINQEDSNDTYTDDKEIESEEIALKFRDLSAGTYDLEVEIYEEDSESDEEFKIYQGSTEVVVDGSDTNTTITTKLTDAEQVVIELSNLPEDTADGFIKLLPIKNDLKEDISLVEGENEAKVVFDEIPANYYDFSLILEDETGEEVYRESYIEKLYAYPGQRTTNIDLELPDDSKDGEVEITVDWQVTPDKPEELTASSDGENVTVSWEGTTEYYFLYRGESADDYELVQNTLITDNQYTDTDVEVGETYYYRLRAYDEDYLASSLSEAVSVSVVEPSEPEINVTPAEGEYPGNTEISVEILNAGESSIEFAGKEIGNTFVLSEYLAEGETGTLDVSASNEVGTNEEKLDYTYRSEEDFDGVKIYYQADSTPYIWVWEEDDDEGGISISEEMGYDYDENHSQMQAIDDNAKWYVFEIPQSWENDEGEEVELTGSDIYVRFNRDEANNQHLIPPETAWYDGEWHSENPDRFLKPSIEITPSGGELRGAANISVEMMGYEISDASIEFDGNEISTAESFAFNLEDYLADGESGTLKASATNHNGTVTEELDFTRDDDAELGFTWDNATVYFAITDRFKDGNPDNNNAYGRPEKDAWGENTGTFHGGDLAGLTEKLNEGYFENLGVDAIWISAAYEQVHGWVGGGADGDFAHYAYHGYYALDYTTTDASFGTVKEMKEFVDTAHEQDIRIVMDIVMNHPGYHTIVDMDKFDFGHLDGIDGDWTPDRNAGETWHDAPDYMEGGSEDDWASWWGSDWAYARIAENVEMPGYEISQEVENLYGLPEFKTRMYHDDPAGVPPILETKWSQEDNYNDWVLPAARELRKDLQVPPAEYITKWLVAWVEEFGIDGFRVDTASHVPYDRWKDLQVEANEALGRWREDNPDRPSSDWDDEFWMTAEIWGHGVTESDIFNYGFESVINFDFQGQDGGGPAENDPAEMEDTYSHYADLANSSSNRNYLSYISQHDTHLHDRNELIDGGTNLLLVPGAAKIFYGDEIARVEGEGLSDGAQATRSSMDWDDKDDEVLKHFQKLGQFRNRNVAVGAGEHKEISNSPYTFGRVYQQDGFDNRVVVAIADESTEVEVGDVFIDGTEVRNAYNGEEATVEDGSVSFTGENNVILIERD